jgi:hypothetical protein
VTQPKIMGHLVLPTRWRALGWIATSAMALVTVGMFVSMRSD